MGEIPTSPNGHRKTGAVALCPILGIRRGVGAAGVESVVTPQDLVRQIALKNFQTSRHYYIVIMISCVWLHDVNPPLVCALLCTCLCFLRAAGGGEVPGSIHHRRGFDTTSGRSERPPVSPTPSRSRKRNYLMVSRARAAGEIGLKLGCDSSPGQRPLRGECSREITYPQRRPWSLQRGGSVAYAHTQRV